MTMCHFLITMAVRLMEIKSKNNILIGQAFDKWKEGVSLPVESSTKKAVKEKVVNEKVVNEKVVDDKVLNEKAVNEKVVNDEEKYDKEKDEVSSDKLGNKEVYYQHWK